jgi:hypothetical protein
MEMPHMLCGLDESCMMSLIWRVQSLHTNLEHLDQYEHFRILQLDHMLGRNTGRKLFEECRSVKRVVVANPQL